MSNTAALNHKEITAHIRNRIKIAGVKASVSKYTSCGVSFVRVAVPAADVVFSNEEQRKINIIAQVNGMTLSRGLPIIIDQFTNPQQFNFVMP
jgi:hypothetical protein